jgi:hypothetical protein
MNSLQLIVGHLNTSVGNQLTEEQLASALKLGKLSEKKGDGSALLSYLFLETEPRLIALCVLETNSTIERANALYLDTLTHHAPRSPAWELSIGHLL